MQHSTKKLGMMFTLGGWIIGFLILALAFTKILDHQDNPNQSVATSQSGQSQQIELKRNRNGHYVFIGEINQKPVSFLVDTGATITSIPSGLQRYLGLKAGQAFQVSTANGVATAYMTRLDEVRLGEIRLTNVRASLNPGLADDSILLGMNVLKHLELVQRGNSLIIRQIY
ncbi:MAG: TIGR02281 family clan AA aspartic protease [Gammaproteobacteria bacterium]|nr:MAG: TIGR02281 family clan AA aspartic protease [Gammaproteobacteria bacterium]